MQDNTESEKPEDSSENEDQTLETEEIVEDSGSNEDQPPGVEETAEDSGSSESDPKFEEQEGEVLPPEEKKKPGAGKVFFFLILLLVGSGSYLYFNNHIPSEILNLFSPKTPPSKPIALITKTPPPFTKEEVKSPEPEETGEEVEPPVTEPEFSETPEKHISGNVEKEPKPTPHISGSAIDQMFTKEEKTLSIEESQPEKTKVPQITKEVEPKETPEPTQEAVTIEAEPQQEELATDEKAVVVEFNREPVTETISHPAQVEPAEPAEFQRSKASQAYLSFIESSVQKLGEFIKNGFIWGWDYLKKNSLTRTP